MTDCDLIVVGAGSAGCLLASQLAGHTRLSVVLLEPPSKPAPPMDRCRPARWLNLLGSGDDWSVPTEPCAAIAGRALTWPRGRGMGGSSRINAMIWFPPTTRDWQDLSAASGGAWSIADLRETLAETESLVRPETPRWLSESSLRFLDTVTSWDRSEPMIYQRVNRQGRRWTPAELLAGSSNHVQIIRATVDRVLFDGDDAAGVLTTERGDPIRCRHGVILCAGAIATPTILMRSGIGPQDVLRDAGVALRLDSPQVGSGLQDHLIMPVIFQLPSHRRFQPVASTRDVAHWQTLGGGPLSCNIAECGGMFADGKLQIHVTPTHYFAHPKRGAPAAMTIGVNVSRPDSRGRLTITSCDPHQSPRIETGYLSEAADLQTTIEGVRLCRQIACSEPLDRWHGGEMLPGAKRNDDQSIARSIARYAQTLYHPVGTCAMGTAPNSVVDASMRVKGAEKLWLADASALPNLTVGNPVAAVLTLAMLCGKRILTATDRSAGFY